MSVRGADRFNFNYSRIYKCNTAYNGHMSCGTLVECRLQLADWKDSRFK